MRTATLTALCVALLAAAANLADDKTPKEEPKLSKDSYVKVRIEVELRGVLRAGEKGVNVTARDRVYNLFEPEAENPDWSRSAVYTLDFARAQDLRDVAEAMAGKEVVVTGMAEVRRIVQKVNRPPGGQGFSGPNPPAFSHPMPTWGLQQTVLVTGLAAAEKN